MRILILGGDGMLGHRLLVEFGGGHDTAITLRGPCERYAGFPIFDSNRCFCDVDARDFDSIERAVDAFGPQVVINAIGLVKQRDDADDRRLAIEINALLPHRLAALCCERRARLVHISTDCVFSGRRGLYRETDNADAEDVYGRTKFLGEVAAPGCLTLRTSIIGRELSRKRSLLEWLMAQHGEIRGFTKAVFSGLTTLEFSKVVRMLVERHPEAHGLYHVASQPIDKFSLLMAIKDALDLPVEIVPDDSVVVDRSLDGSLFNQTYDYNPPSWDRMVTELRDD
jgi:dTDP-4-dehydrorhamnose reductase